MDTKHKLIAEQEVTSQVLDMGLLAPNTAAAMETLGVETNKAVADPGYFKFEEIEACEAAIGVTGGLIVSTLLSLVFVPSFYTMMDDLSGWVAQRGARRLNPRQAAPPKI